MKAEPHNKLTPYKEKVLIYIELGGLVVDSIEQLREPERIDTWSFFFSLRFQILCERVLYHK